ncbi:hypothetical protein HF086_003339 [Spodoptera exigua]|uniref:Uncharacterized protein n=1 Tax=Spodoptera exigua TaxID=7107 RepID=A0A922MY71_SPOEX|nr:hypothetical protein HF086_003339 [Spodoptera exigua]
MSILLYSVEYSDNIRLEEAIEAILQDGDDDEYDLAIIPPYPNALTDGGADEDMGACFMPQDILGTIETTSEVCDRKSAICEELNGLNSVQIFENLFDMIITNSKLFANQHNRHDIQLDSSSLKRVLGVRIFQVQ